MSPSLDRADKKILFELDCNSRQSLSELARSVRLGRDLVEYRIQRLQDSGVLNRCSLLVNPYKLGLTVYKTYLRLETNKTRLAELVKKLDQHPNTYWLAEASGEWDLMFSILARTPKEFFDFQDQILSGFSDIILGFNVYTLVNYWMFPKKYLLGPEWQLERASKSKGGENPTHDLNGWSFHTPEFTFGTTPDSYSLDELEFRMLNLLGNNARLGFAELATQLGTTPSVVKYRFDKLQELGVVAGARIDVDLSVLGRTLYTVMVHLRDYSVEKEREFREFCRIHPLISCYAQQIGSHKIEFEVEAQDQAEFHAVIDEIKERFSKFVRTMDYAVIRRNYHYRTPCTVFAPAHPDRSKLAVAEKLIQQAV